MYAQRTLAAGFTSVRNVGADDFVDVGLRNAINAGITEGPRILTAVHGLAHPAGTSTTTLSHPIACGRGVRSRHLQRA